MLAKIRRDAAELAHILRVNATSIFALTDGDHWCAIILGKDPNKVGLALRAVCSPQDGAGREGGEFPAELNIELLKENQDRNCALLVVEAFE
jgi:hypothetical protein